MRPLTKSGSHLGLSVSHVLLVRGEKEVIWIDADSVVAAMRHFLVAWIAAQELPREPVSAAHLAAPEELTVTLLLARCGPLPAAVSC